MTMNFDSDGIDRYDEIVNAFMGRGSYSYASKKLDPDLKNRSTPPVKPSMDKPSVLGLKALPSHLYYAFLGPSNTLSIILAIDLLERQVKALVLILQRFNWVIGWITTDIVKIPPKISTHKIWCVPKCIHSIHYHHRLKPPMQDIVRK